jgi:pimeloyl-ACP methyl ester carboxylesterase
MWGQQIPDLVDAGFRCVTPDRRGHGRSDCPGDGYDLDTLAADLGRLIGHLALSDPILIGHSMGASEVVRYAGRSDAGPVERIVLSAPTLPALLRTDANPGGVDRAVFEEAWSAMKADLGAWMSRTTHRDYFGPGWPMADDLGTWTRQQIAATPLPVLLACQRSFIEADARADLARLGPPALVVHGDADTSCPLEITGRPTAELVPDGRLVVIEGAGHGLYASAAARYNAVLLDFLTAERRPDADAEPVAS